MGFEERLRRIRGQSAVAGPAPGPPAGPSLVERLRRLSTGRGPSEPAAGRTPDASALAAALGAAILAPGVLCLERRLAPRPRHGRVLLGVPLVSDRPPWTAVHPVAGASATHPPDTEPTGAWLCLDTETSGLAGGTGTWAFLTGLLRADGDGWLLRQYLLTQLDAEPEYLARVGAELTAPVRLVTYNGRGFDAPLLATRFRLAGQRNALAEHPHLDLLGPTRRAFSRRWPDCRLVTAESRLLGFVRTGDLPGSAAPAAWLDWLRRGETGPLAAVLRHNRDDLLSLAGLLPALEAVYHDPAVHGADVRAVAAAWQPQDPARALRILSASRHDLDAPGLRDLARLYRRGGDWGGALNIWEGLAADGDGVARAALARFHEHRSGDLARALELTESLPPGPDREHRRERLRAKLDRRDRQIEMPITPASADLLQVGRQPDRNPWR